MSMDYVGKKVLLLDGYGRQIPSLLHQLRGLGCRVTTMCESRWDVGWTSRLPSRRVVVHGIREDRAVYDAAVRKELENGYDILFPVLERATDICLAEDLRRKYPGLKVIASDRASFDKAYDKQETMRACMENGIPCPVTKLDGESMEDYLAKVGFPICAKPRKGSGAAGFKRIHDRGELERLLADGSVVPEECVIQELIPKGGLQYGAYLMMDAEHRPQSTLVVESCRWFPIDGGPGCYIRTIDHPGIADSAGRLLRCLGWRSFGHVGLIMDPRDGTPKVMEINGRIPASIKICEWAGTEPVRNMLDLAHGVPLRPMEHSIEEHLALRYFHTDLMWFLKNPDRWKAKPAWFDFRRQKDYIFDWSDPLPFFSYAVEHVLTYRKDMAKRKH